MSDHTKPMAAPPEPTYAQRMPAPEPRGDAERKPKRKAMFLGPQALDDLAATSARRRTEREAVEEALALLAERDRRDAALAEFVATVHATFGEPTSAEVAEADELYEQYRELRANR